MFYCSVLGRSISHPRFREGFVLVPGSLKYRADRATLIDRKQRIICDPNNLWSLCKHEARGFRCEVQTLDQSFFAERKRVGNSLARKINFENRDARIHDWMIAAAEDLGVGLLVA